MSQYQTTQGSQKSCCDLKKAAHLHASFLPLGLVHSSVAVLQVRGPGGSPIRADLGRRLVPRVRLPTWGGCRALLDLKADVAAWPGPPPPCACADTLKIPLNPKNPKSLGPYTLKPITTMEIRQATGIGPIERRLPRALQLPCQQGTMGPCLTRPERHKLCRKPNTESQ